jgi:Cu(I)/Ag(I) efflux system membrane fusion protein
VSGARRLISTVLVAAAAAWGGLAAGERGVTLSGLQETMAAHVEMMTGRDAAAMPAAEPTGPVTHA